MSDIAASNKALVEKFYTAFANRDADAMRSCYHESIVFQDPAFGVLNGSDAGDMWGLLLSGPAENADGTKALVIEFSDVETTETQGSAKWVAHYKFSSTGRPVVNKITASFEFKDGLIIKHTDVFDFWTWSSQALGFSGYALGWTSFLNNKVSKQANEKLAKYVAKKNAPAEPAPEASTEAPVEPAVEPAAAAPAPETSAQAAPAPVTELAPAAPVDESAPEAPAAEPETAAAVPAEAPGVSEPGPVEDTDGVQHTATARG